MKNKICDRTACNLYVERYKNMERTERCSEIRKSFFFPLSQSIYIQLDFTLIVLFPLNGKMEDYCLLLCVRYNYTIS